MRYSSDWTQYTQGSTRATWLHQMLDGHAFVIPTYKNLLVYAFRNVSD